MCGIAGVVGDIDPATAERAVDAMLLAELHRGPDSGGSVVRTGPWGTLALGTRRLAIIDRTQAGTQPMVDHGTGHVLVYNGELYNFRDLATELAGTSTFHGRSDTEVVLRAWQRWGPGCLERLSGMYAFAMWDPSRAELTLVRDRLGIKPLYVASIDRGIAFASEVRALLASGLLERRIDHEALDSYLAYGAVQEPHSLVRGIRCLPAGHLEVIDASEVSVRRERYWRVPFAASDAATRPPAPEVTRGILERVIERHLISDAPLGVFLSGGIDSSAIVALAVSAQVDLRTFSVVFADQEFDEAPYSRLVADRFGTKHTETEVSSSDLLSMLPRALEAIDQPTHDGMNVFVVSQLARDAGVVVALSGQGSDEIFAGYSTFRAIPAALEQRNALTSAAGAVVQRVLRSNPRLAASQRLRLLSAKDALDAYAVIRGMFAPSLRSALLGDRTFPDHGLPPDRADDLRAAIGHLHPVDQVSYLELDIFLRNTLLRDGDVMSMANSVEVRVPFLDDELVEYVAAISGGAKLDDRLPKPLLVRSLADLMPEEVYARPKRGFTLPWTAWLRGDLADSVAAILASPDAGLSIGMRPGACEEVWNAFRSQQRVIAWPMVWSLFVLLDWCTRHRITA